VAIYKQRIGEASQVLTGAQGLEERCPRRVATLLRLALAGVVSKEDEAKAFADSIRDEPDYQPAYSSHLRFLQPRWHGAPGDWDRAAMEIASMPGGKERLARAVWFLDDVNAFDTGVVAWPVVRQGFLDMRARHPESLEIKSAFCMFASYYGDRDETKRMLDEIGNRMDTNVWKSREQFVRAYHWATFEQGELAGGDPLARFFGWIMGS
jgi:hypothetical protein